MRPRSAYEPHPKQKLSAVAHWTRWCARNTRCTNIWFLSGTATYVSQYTCVHFCVHIICAYIILVHISWYAQDHHICCYAYWTQTGQKQIYGEVINVAGPTKRHAPVTIIIPTTARHRGIFHGWVVCVLEDWGKKITSLLITVKVTRMSKKNKKKNKASCPGLFQTWAK